jgi:hypothetical protein
MSRLNIYNHGKFEELLEEFSIGLGKRLWRGSKESVLTIRKAIEEFSRQRGIASYLITLEVWCRLRHEMHHTYCCV